MSKKKVAHNVKSDLPPINDRLREARDYTIATMERRIQKAQIAAGFNVEKNLKRLQKVISRGTVESDRDAISAIKVGTEITGERMPERQVHDVHTDEDILDRLAGI